MKETYIHTNCIRGPRKQIPPPSNGYPSLFAMEIVSLDPSPAGKFLIEPQQNVSQERPFRLQVTKNQLNAPCSEEPCIEVRTSRAHDSEKLNQKQVLLAPRLKLYVYIDTCRESCVI